MYRIGFAQEIITPPAGVGLAGYMNKRPNVGMYDDLYVKALIFDSDGSRCGLLTFDLCSVCEALFKELKRRITEKFGAGFHDRLIICATHTHTGPEFRGDGLENDERVRYAFEETAAAAVRALERAVMNLLPGEIEVGTVYNNPFGFVRRYWMKSGAIVTNPGWCNPEIDRPESDFDRTIGILKVIQNGRPAALVCNIVNHGDTIGGDLVSADWYGCLARAVQHELKCGLPVIVIDDASGDVNHFDFHQKIGQTSIKEANRIGRGYAAIVLDALDKLEKLPDGEITVGETAVTIPHRKLTPEEVAEAEHILQTVPDIPKEGDFESQDLANKVPAALRYFAQRALDCHTKSVDSHEGRITALKFGKTLAIVSLPGEPFNGISRAIKAQSPFRYTFVASLAQSVSGYVPMKECFPRGGYEVMPAVDSPSPEAAQALIDAAVKTL
ncbi:MAG: neutral/alkaline non-lysosomal ceramidase N-terminal domain-containing protein [Lentisphaeria bacterium]|nr:neutral/alkaline non-lysosomal ceramidase N-terminal domain-containing protein [Lentisphaeria bacterium]